MKIRSASPNFHGNMQALVSLPVSLLATAGRDNRGHTESYGWCIESFDTAVFSPLPLAILFQGRAHRVLGEH